MKIHWNTIIQGDNLPVLEKFAKEDIKFDLICADPPYNLGKNFGNDTDNLPTDIFLSKMDQRLKILSELLSDNGSIIWFCTHRLVGHIQVMMHKYFQYRRLLIWHYRNGISRQTKEPVTEYEPFLWFSKSDKFTYNLDDMRVPYKSERVKNPCYKKDKNGVKKAWYPNPKGAKRGDIWECPVLSGKLYMDERTEHPTQKPEKLITDIIKAFCPKKNGKYNGTILDPYIGSGTLGVCCERLNKQGEHNIKWMGIEMEERWVKTGRDRIEQEKKRCYETDLFKE